MSLTCLTWKLVSLTSLQIHFISLSSGSFSFHQHVTLLFLITPKLSYKTYTLNQIWNKFTTASCNWHQLNTLQDWRLTVESPGFWLEFYPLYEISEGGLLLPRSTDKKPSWRETQTLLLASLPAMFTPQVYSPAY